MIDGHIRRLIIAETELVDTAERALEAQSPRNMHRHTRALLEAAEIHVETVKDSEGGHDYRLLAAEILAFAVTDPRLIMEVPPEQIDPNSRLSQRLQVRRERWPAVSGYLDTLIHRVSV